MYYVFNIGKVWQPSTTLKVTDRERRREGSSNVCHGKNYFHGMSLLPLPCLCYQTVTASGYCVVASRWSSASTSVVVRCVWYAHAIAFFVGKRVKNTQL